MKNQIIGKIVECEKLNVHLENFLIDNIKWKDQILDCTCEKKKDKYICEYSYNFYFKFIDQSICKNFRIELTK